MDVMSLVRDSTSQSISIEILQNASATSPGDPKTDVVYSDGTLSLWYRRGGQGTKTAITPATLALVTTAYSSGGFIHVSDGVYRLDIPDAAIAVGSDGANELVVGGTVDGGVILPVTIQLTDELYVQGTFDGAGTTTGGDLGGNAPSYDITGTIYLPKTQEATKISSYNTGTGAVVWAPATQAPSSGDPWLWFPEGFIDASTISAIQSGLATSTQATNIQNKTDNLPTDPADESLIIAATDALGTAISNLNMGAIRPYR